LLLALALPGGCTCEGNGQGYLQAPSGGDLSQGPAPRQAYESEIKSACGTIGPSSESAALHRHPYLQEVTQSQATLVWTSASSDLEMVLLTPDGRESQRAAGVVDDTAAPAQAMQLQARFAELSPDTIYCYQLRAPGADSDFVYAGGFRTAPGPDGSIRFSALGDLGASTSDQKAVLEQLKTVHSDLLLIPGDIAYESGTLAQFESHFFGVYRDLLALVPVFPASGNHDYQSADAAAFREVFVLPTNGGADGRERWYSFDWGPVHFAILDSEVRLEEQATWLRADLKASPLPWKVAVVHKPPYSSGDHGSEDSIRKTFVPVFREEGVQLVLSGHDHNYERSTLTDGVTYVVTGGGGRGTRKTGSSSFTAFAARVAHFVYVVADANTLTLHAIDATGQDFDSLRLTR
jgi:3',5'-cyclic AMP phosphodiesterase CpdA